MITIRASAERGATRIAWLDSRHTFSFGDYFDPGHMGFRTLRVINDDRVAPNQGFGMHGHRDMEILTYLLEGSLEHRDSLGNGSVMRRSDVQRMSAGTGIRHREFNPSPIEPVHFLQIWLVPERDGLEPSYAQRHFTDDEKNAQLKLIASRAGRDGSLTIHQDVELFAALLGPGEHVRHQLQSGRHAWVQVAEGELTLNGQSLKAGDGAGVTDETVLDLAGIENSEFLLFDLA